MIRHAVVLCLAGAASCGGHGTDPTEANLEVDSHESDPTADDDVGPGTDGPADGTDSANLDTDKDTDIDIDDTDVIRDTAAAPRLPPSGYELVRAGDATRMFFLADGTWVVVSATRDEINALLLGTALTAGCEVTGNWTVTDYDASVGAWTVDLGHTVVDVTATAWDYDGATFQRCDNCSRWYNSPTCPTPTPWVD